MDVSTLNDLRRIQAYEKMLDATNDAEGRKEIKSEMNSIIKGALNEESKDNDSLER